MRNRINDKQDLLLDCACIAAVAALAHFRRPDVTTTGDGVFIIHSSAEKDLIPIVLHHYPICVSYALFNEGKIPVADPTALEERVSDASLVLAINSYKELCCLHLAGVSLTSPTLIIKCSEMAAERSSRIVRFIKSALEEDESERNKGNFPKGFAECIQLSNVASNFHSEANVDRTEDSETSAMEDEEMEKTPQIKKINSSTATTQGWKSKATSSEESSSDDEEDVVMEQQKDNKAAKKTHKNLTGDSSEEEETVVLK